MKNKYHATSRKLLLLASATLSLAAAYPASAANTLYNPGDLILFFQKFGSSNTVYVGLDSAALAIRGSAAGPTADSHQTNILNINSTMVSAFGAGWATDTTIFAGAAAVRSTSSSLTQVTDGDPARTLYASQSRSSVGTVGIADSVTPDFSLTGFSGPATAINGIGTSFDILPNDAASAVIPTSATTLDEQVQIVSGLGGALTQPSAFGAFPGGVMQQGSATAFGTFTDVGQVEFALDIYRILPRITAPGQVTGPDKFGSFEGSVVVATNGDVSFLTISAVPEPSGTLALGLLGTVAGLGYRRRRSA